MITFPFVLLSTYIILLAPSVAIPLGLVALNVAKMVLMADGVTV